MLFLLQIPCCLEPTIKTEDTQLNGRWGRRYACYRNNKIHFSPRPSNTNTHSTPRPVQHLQSNYLKKIVIYRSRNADRTWLSFPPSRLPRYNTPCERATRRSSFTVLLLWFHSDFLRSTSNPCLIVLNQRRMLNRIHCVGFTDKHVRFPRERCPWWGKKGKGEDRIELDRETSHDIVIDHAFETKILRWVPSSRSIFIATRGMIFSRDRLLLT